MPRAACLMMLLLGGCPTVDLGPETGPPAGCTAKSDYFVSDVWPRYFEKYSCGKSDCHDSSSGRGFFRLQAVAGVTAPQPADPVSLWPAPWQANLRAVELNLSCGNPLSSAVLAIPAGRSQPHPGGNVVTDMTEADLLFRMWLQ